MKTRLNCFALLLALAASFSSIAQDFSNKGKEFWLSYSYHVGMSGGAGGAPTMTLYITSDQNSTYNVEVFGGASIQTGSITAGQVVSIIIPTSLFINDEGVFNNKTLRVTSSQPVVVYSYITRSQASGATLALPTNVLGRDYYSFNFTQNSNEPNSNSYFTIIAVEDNTTVEITPSANTKGGWAAGSTNTINLNKGQIYQVLGVTTGNNGVDLTGSRIRSVASTTGGCKRIAVFSGSGKISIGCTGGSSDNLYQQLYPTGTWGQKYMTVPSYGKPNNYYRIIKSDPSANVYLNGSLIPSAAFTNNRYYEFLNNTPNLIEADKPIAVAQYFTTQGCSGNGNPYDPDMIVLNPVEQNIDKVTLVSSNLYAPTNPPNQPHQHHMHVIMRNGGTGISSFSLDGVPVSSGLWVAHPSDLNYSYLYLNNVSQGYHRLTSDSGFNAIAYGYGSAESYGYSAGANVKDLYQFVSVQNQYATVNFPATCKGTPFYFSMWFPYQPTQIQWQFNGLFSDVTITNPTFDSTQVVNGRTLYRYKLPNPYSINTPGTYPIKVVAQNPTPDGCSGEQEITYDLQVFDRPTSDFNFITNGCVSDSVRFTDNASTTGRPVIKYSWDFGDGNTSLIRNPSHLYLSPGSFNVKYSVITDVGCLSDTSIKTVNISQPPVAKFGVAAPYCVGKTITFTDSSTTSSSTISKWYWNFGDGSPQVVATTNAPQTHIYNNTGSFTVTLQVETATGCKSTVFNRNVIINPNPVAAFIFGNACLPSGTMQFTNTSTISDGTQSQFSYSWNFGDGNTSTQQNPSHNYAAVGPFNVTLTITSGAGCTDDSVRVVNTIYARPDAAFSMNPTAESCLGSNVTFTDQSTAPNSSTASWQWNFGDGNTSTLQNPVHLYAVPGIYTVTLTTTSAIGCVSDVEQKTITILPLPVASFTASAIRCEKQPIQFSSTSIANAGNIVQNQWYVNGTLISSTGTTFTYTPPNAGSYTIRLAVTTDKGCTDDTTITINANPRPVPNFNLPNVCLPAGNAQFTNTSTISDGSSLTYQWNFGDGNTSNQTNPTNIYTATGPYNVTLTATSANGCFKDTVKVLSTIFAQPQSTINAPAEVCFGSPVNFTDAGTIAPGSTITQWQWNFGDGNTSTQQNPMHNYTNAGTYAVTLTATSAVGCPSAIATRTVVVNSLPAANFNVSAPNCATRDITFTDVSVANSGNITKWTWNMGDGTVYNKTTNAPFIHNYAATGTYNVTLQVETNKGCISTVFSKPVIVSPLPVAAFGMPENCLNDPFSQFSDSSTIADGTESQFTYLWNFGDPNATAGNPNTSNQKNPQHRYIQAATYNVTLTVTSNNGCSATITQPFTLNGDIPQAAFTVQGGLNHCSDDDVTITNNSTVDFGSVTKLEIYWDYGNNPTNRTIDNTPVQGGTYVHRYPVFYSPATQTFLIRVVAYSGDNCISSTTQTITVKARPQLVFDAMPSVCADAAAFQVTQARMTNGLPGNGTYSGPGITAAGLFTPLVAGKGTHTIRYTYNASNGCPSFIEKTISVFEVAVANAGPDRFVLEGGTVTLVGSGTGPNLSYVWSPTAGLNNPSIALPVASPADDVTYSLRVTTADVCTDDDQVFVKVLKAPTIPNTFSPNRDNIHDKWEIKYLESYPGCTVQIYNRYGQLVFESKGYSKPWDGTYKGKDVPAGTYYYIIDPKNGRKQMTGFVDVIR